MTLSTYAKLLWKVHKSSTPSRDNYAQSDRFLSSKNESLLQQKWIWHTP